MATQKLQITLTKRFSEETTTDDECSETIDWSELVKAAEAAEKQFDLTSEKEDDKIQKEIPKETGYLGDIDTSSSKSSETQSSDSDDDISRTSRKGSISGRECKIGLQRDQHREDRTGDTEEPNGGINRDFTETLHQFDLTSKNENGQVKSDDPKETGYLEDADASSSEASAPQSSDPEDDISVGTTTKTPATTTTATRKGYISGRECQDRKGAIVKDPTGGNDRDFTETLHQFDFKSEKENYQTEIDLPQETGYSGDEETSTSESSEPQSFDSKDDFARTSWKVPPEILTRGPLALEAYKKALSEGKTSVKTVPVIFIGQDRCGKTSLKKSLVREPFNPHEDIKVKVDVDPIYFKVSTETWKEEEDRETGFEAAVSYEQATARLVEETFLECRDMPSVSGLRFPDVLEDLQWSEKSKDPGSNQTYKEPADIDSKNSCDEPGGGKCSTTITSLTNLRQTIFQEVDIVEDQEEIHPVLWDFTGQSVYYTTNPLFLTARAIYLLVHDLSLNPYERARSSLKQGTNLDYLDFWMSCVASIATERDEQGSKSEVFPEKNPPVLLVCTHADRAYGGFDARTLANNVFGSLQTNSNQTHSCKDVFVVDNTNSECSEVMRLRDKIRDVAMELPQIKEAIPIKWLRYEKALQVMKEKWITIDGAKEIASQVCDVVDDDQFHTLLSFLHEKRILIHFDDTPELNRLVVLDPQWLIDECNKLVIISPYHDREKGEFEEPWRKLKQEGILEEKLLEHIWFPLFHSKEILESFTAMMEKFSLLCLLPSPDAFCRKQYLVPSMLSHPPGGNEEVICSTPVPPLFLVFESGCVPLGLFPRLVLKFFQWIKVKYTSPLDPQLCHNFARFYTSEERNFSVDLLCHSCTIEVVLHPGYSSHDLEDSLKSKLSMSADASYNTCARAVCRQLGLILGSMGKEFPWLKNMKYGFSLICPVCCHGGTVNYCRTHHTRGCKKEECLHFWPVPESCNAEQMFCTRSAAALNNRICAEQLAPWFASLGEQHAVNENGGMHLRYVDDSALNLPDEVPDSLLSLQVNLHNDEEIVPMEGCLQPSQTSPEQPKPDLFKGVMLDVAKNPREITTAETTGPLSKEHLDVHNISVYQRREVAIESSGGDEWKVVAQELNQLDNFILHPFDAALASISSLRY